MPKFYYKAKKGLDKIENGEIVADSKDSAISRLIESGMAPLEIISDEQYKKGREKQGFFKNYGKRITTKDLNIFTRQMASLIKSRVELLKALRIIWSQTEKQTMKKIILSLHDTVKDGKTFSTALSRHPRYFTPLYISMIKVDEVSGRLDLALEQLANFADKEEEFKTKVKTALTYPALMLIVGLISVTVLITFVIPKLKFVFEDLGQSLPAATRGLILFSEWVSRFWYIAALAAGGSVFLIKKTIQGGNREFWDRWKLRLPLVSVFFLDASLARFSRAFALLLKNSVPLFQSLEISIPTLGNSILIRQLEGVRQDVINGQLLSTSLRKIPAFSPFLINMISVGEEGGRLDEVLLTVAVDYERQVDAMVKILTSLIEPLIILFLGAVVGFIVMAMLLPIFQMNMLAG